MILRKKTVKRINKGQDGVFQNKRLSFLSSWLKAMSIFFHALERERVRRRKRKKEQREGGRKRRFPLPASFFSLFHSISLSLLSVLSLSLRSCFLPLIIHVFPFSLFPTLISFFFSLLPSIESNSLILSTAPYHKHTLGVW